MSRTEPFRALQRAYQESAVSTPEYYEALINLVSKGQAPAEALLSTAKFRFAESDITYDEFEPIALHYEPGLEDSLRGRPARDKPFLLRPETVTAWYMTRVLSDATNILILDSDRRLGTTAWSSVENDCHIGVAVFPDRVNTLLQQTARQENLNDRVATILELYQYNPLYAKNEWEIDQPAVLQKVLKYDATRT